MLPEETFAYGKKNNYDNPIGYLLGRIISNYIKLKAICMDFKPNCISRKLIQIDNNKLINKYLEQVGKE